MKKAAVIILSLFVFIAIGVTAFADCGPKPSVTLYVNGVEDGREYYIALLEKREFKGTFVNENDDVVKKINELAKADGYSISDHPVDSPYYKKTGSTTVRWGYMPPQTFKILLYFPDNESFLVSDVQDKYAFAAYYYVEVNGDSLSVSKNGGTKGTAVEVGGLLVRIVLTVLIEIGVAFGFGYRNKRMLRVILITNIITQLLLNALIAYGDYVLGGLGSVVAYIFGEIVVFLAEAIVFSVKLPTIPEGGTVGRAWLYAFVANLASFFGGGFLLLMTDTLFDYITKGSIIQ